jgi:hypothetical protein
MLQRGVGDLVWALTGAGRLHTRPGDQIGIGVVEGRLGEPPPLVDDGEGLVGGNTLVPKPDIKYCNVKADNQLQKTDLTR